MTLSFSTHINGQPTRFVEKIWKGFYNHFFDSIAQQHYDYSKKMLSKFNSPLLVSGVESGKIHTIRADKSNRWQAGNKIHFVIKNRTPDRFQFAPIIRCKSVQKIDIVWSRKFDGKNGTVIILIDEQEFAMINICRQQINDLNNLKGLEELSINDGFNSVKDFLDYFNDDFTGKIIHWTDYQY